MHSFTQETTFYGKDKPSGFNQIEDLHMDIGDYKNLGVDLAKSISFYLNSEFMENLESEASKHK